MKYKLRIYNTLTRQVEEFNPVVEGWVKMYVCGPTVYSSPHIGHARSICFFDLLHRLFLYLGYKVKYVRNVTDIGHMESDEDEGEDKIIKKARELNIRPEEVAHKYFLEYIRLCEKLNALDPSVQPFATAHIQEQINLVKKIIENGYAYVVNGSVYFDVPKFHKDYGYGRLSNRKLEDLLSFTREIKGKEEKHSPYDFSLWKRASPSHIMQWESPWGKGFPGWHLECSAMAIKYLGEKFDIHGGGIDLIFPHHDCEIAQNIAAYNSTGPNYFIHNNLITVDGKKMSKQLGNYILPFEIIKGELDFVHLRFYLLSAHYRSPLNFTIKNFQSAAKSLNSLFDTWSKLEILQPSDSSTFPIDATEFKSKVLSFLLDDLNTPELFSYIFTCQSDINALISGHTTISHSHLEEFKKTWNSIFIDLLGLIPQRKHLPDLSTQLLEIIINTRNILRKKGEYSLADEIRSKLGVISIKLVDSPNGTTWTFSSN